MKFYKIAIFLILSFLQFRIFTQPFVGVYYSALGDDIDSWNFAEIDTNRNNSWQLAYNENKSFGLDNNKIMGLMTDSIKAYQKDNESTFHITIKENSQASWVSLTLIIEHSYITDNKHDGGYIEISYDGGKTWQNMLKDYILLEQSPMKDTIIGGIYAFTGNSNGIQNNIFQIDYCNDAVPNIIDSAIMRFTFKSDSIESKKPGWFITYFQLTLYVGGDCTSSNNVIKVNQFNIFPLPLTSTSQLQLQNPSNYQLYTLAIFNINGKAILRQNNITLPYQLYRDDFNAGIHFLQLQQKNEVIYKGKFLVE